MYQRILVPIDSSPPSNRGLEEAIRVAKLTGGRLRLIPVVDELSMELYTSARAGGWLDALRASGERILERAKADALGNGVEVDTVLHSDFSGPLDQKVASEARRWPADLIVLGTHGPRNRALDVGQRCAAHSAHLDGARPAGACAGDRFVGSAGPESGTCGPLARRGVRIVRRAVHAMFPTDALH